MKNLFKIILFLSISFSFISCEKEEEIGVKKPLSILVLGNSITYSLENPSIGWLNNCGMAASSIDKDFCSLILKEIPKNSTLERKNIAYWEQNLNYNLNEMFSPNTNYYDYVVIKIGENVSDNNPLFKESLQNLTNRFNSSKIILVTTVWRQYELDVNENYYEVDSYKDRIIKEVAEENNYIFCDISEIKNNSNYFAWGDYENSGVGSHPNDSGMEFIANKIIQEIQ